MYSLNQVNKLVSCGRDPARSLPFWRGFLLIPLILVCFAVAPQTQAQLAPPPDGAYPNFTTAEGFQALFSLTTGVANTAVGWRTLFLTTDGSFNTALGAGDLVLNTATDNTAVGSVALLLNTEGGRNTAVGAAALLFNKGDATTQDGFFNDAVGVHALNQNVTGFSNNAFGDSALDLNMSGAENTAIGDLALAANDSDNAGMANSNTAVGASSLRNNVDGSQNAAVGSLTGPNVVTGFGNTYVGDSVGSLAGTPDESNTIRIADLSNNNGAGSEACFIGGIFANQQEANGSNIVVVTLNLDDDHLGFDPTITLNGAPKAPYSPNRSIPQPRTRPQAKHQAMINQQVEKLQATVTQQQVTVAQQQKQIEALTTQLKEQAAQLQKVSAQVEMIRPTPRVVENR